MFYNCSSLTLQNIKVCHLILKLTKMYDILQKEGVGEKTHEAFLTVTWITDLPSVCSVSFEWIVLFIWRFIFSIVFGALFGLLVNIYYIYIYIYIYM